jgi:hypothetical protein
VFLFKAIRSKLSTVLIESEGYQYYRLLPVMIPVLQGLFEIGLRVGCAGDAQFCGVSKRSLGTTDNSR